MAQLRVVGMELRRGAHEGGGGSCGQRRHPGLGVAG
jgi:hypothetical protein